MSNILFFNKDFFLIQDEEESSKTIIISIKDRQIFTATSALPKIIASITLTSNTLKINDDVLIEMELISSPSILIEMAKIISAQKIEIQTQMEIIDHLKEDKKSLRLQLTNALPIKEESIPPPKRKKDPTSVSLLNPRIKKMKNLKSTNKNNPFGESEEE